MLRNTIHALYEIQGVIEPGFERGNCLATQRETVCSGGKLAASYFTFQIRGDREVHAMPCRGGGLP